MLARNRLYRVDKRIFIARMALGNSGDTPFFRRGWPPRPVLWQPGSFVSRSGAGAARQGACWRAAEARLAWSHQGSDGDWAFGVRIRSFGEWAGRRLMDSLLVEYEWERVRVWEGEKLTLTPGLPFPHSPSPPFSPSVFSSSQRFRLTAVYLLRRRRKYAPMRHRPDVLKLPARQPKLRLGWRIWGPLGTVKNVNRSKIRLALVLT